MYKLALVFAALAAVFYTGDCCETTEDCPEFQYCSTSVSISTLGHKSCEPQAANGEICVRDAKCLSGNCAWVLSQFSYRCKARD